MCVRERQRVTEGFLSLLREAKFRDVPSCVADKLGCNADGKRLRETFFSKIMKHFECTSTHWDVYRSSEKRRRPGIRAMKVLKSDFENPTNYSTSNPHAKICIVFCRLLLLVNVFVIQFYLCV